MPAVKWTPAAAADVEQLHSFLYAKDEDAAAKAASCILHGAGAYVLRYMLEPDDTVVIIRVWHSKEYRR